MRIDCTRNENKTRPSNGRFWWDSLGYHANKRRAGTARRRDEGADPPTSGLAGRPALLCIGCKIRIFGQVRGGAQASGKFCHKCSARKSPKGMDKPRHDRLRFSSAGAASVQICSGRLRSSPGGVNLKMRCTCSGHCVVCPAPLTAGLKFSGSGRLCGSTEPGCWDAPGSRAAHNNGATEIGSHTHPAGVCTLAVHTDDERLHKQR